MGARERSRRLRLILAAPLGAALLVLLTSTLALAQGAGLYMRPGCTGAQFPSPITGQTWCADTTNFAWKVWNVSAFQTLGGGGGGTVLGTGLKGRPAVWTTTADTVSDSSIFTDITHYDATAVCDGSDIAAKITTAMTAGVKRIYVPGGCSFGAITLPDNTIVQGEGALTLATGFVTAGNYSSLREVTYQGKYLGNFTNATGSAQVADAVNFTALANVYKGHVSGAVDQDVGLSITHKGLGDGDNIFAQTSPDNSAVNFQQALVRGDLYATHPNGGRVFDAFLFASTPPASRGLRISDFRTTIDGPMLYQTTTATTGSIFKFFHTTSAGDAALVGIEMQMAEGSGSFAGSFLKLDKGGVNQVLLTHDGTLRLKSLGVATQRCVQADASGLLSVAATACGAGGGGGTVTDVTGTTNRITSSGGATPAIDISAAYVGQSSITTLGTITSGVWQGTLIAGQYGGTGVANTGKTITLGGNLVTAGAFNTTLTVTADSNATLPAGTKTLVPTDVTALASLLSGAPNFAATTSLTVGVASTTTGLLIFKNAANANNLILTAGTTSASTTFKLPTADGANGACLITDGAGQWSFSLTCGGAAGGISSLGGQTGSTQTFVNDTNVTMTSGSNTHTLGFTGTLAGSRGGWGANIGTPTGVPSFAAGVPSFAATLSPALGGFGADMSAASGALSFNAGVRVVNTLTAPRILYGGASNIIDSDARFFFAAATALLDINGSGGTPAAAISDARVRISGGAAIGVYYQTDSYAAPGNITFQRAQGTVAARTTLVAGNNIGNVTFRGFDGSANSSDQASFGCFAGGTWSGSSRPTFCTWGTTPSGSTTLTEAMRVTSAQVVGLRLTTPRASGLGGLDSAGTIAVTNNANIGSVDFTLTPWNTGGGGLIGWNKTASQGEMDFVAISGGGSDGGFAFYDLNTQLVRIKKNGDTGFGTGSPTSRIHIVSGGGMQIGNPTGGNIANSINVQGNFYVNGVPVSGGGGGAVSGSGAASQVAVWSTVSSITGVSTFVHDGTGLGVGTATPARKLDVVQTTDGVTGGFRLSNSTAGSSVGLSVEAGGSGPVRLETGTAALAINVSGAGNVGIGKSNPTRRLGIDASSAQISLSSGGVDKWIVGSEAVSADRFVFFGGGDYRLTLKTDGTVGIGTPTPEFGLDVVRTSKAARLSRLTLADVNTANSFDLCANCYFVSGVGEKYMAAGFAGRLEFEPSVGTWKIQTAPSGAADASLAYSDRMTVAQTGHVTLTPATLNNPSFANSRPLNVTVTTTGSRTAGVGFVEGNSISGLYVANTDTSVPTLGGGAGQCGSGNQLGVCTSVTAMIRAIEPAGFGGTAYSTAMVYEASGVGAERGAAFAGTFANAGASGTFYGSNAFLGVTPSVTLNLGVGALSEINCQTAACQTRGHGFLTQNLKSAFGTPVTSASAYTVYALTETPANGGIEAWEDAFRLTTSSDYGTAGIRGRWRNDGSILMDVSSAGATTILDLRRTGTIEMQVDNTTSASVTPLLLNYNGALRRVEVGAADSGGAGFRLLRIAN